MSTKRRIRITAEGRIALPADLMRKHQLKVGDEVAIGDIDQGILITCEATDVPMSAEAEASLFDKPSAVEIARRQSLFARMMVSREARDIKPTTSAELLHAARTEEGRMDDPGA
ncbi:MAG: AbrB/MazE/SpoVT family DNA-binding domain-containing protein [Dehalococcoidia bacterium]